MCRDVSDGVRVVRHRTVQAPVRLSVHLPEWPHHGPRCRLRLQVRHGGQHCHRIVSNLRAPCWGVWPALPAVQSRPGEEGPQIINTSAIDLRDRSITCACFCLQQLTSYGGIWGCPIASQLVVIVGTAALAVRVREPLQGELRWRGSDRSTRRCIDSLHSWQLRSVSAPL